MNPAVYGYGVAVLVAVAFSFTGPERGDTRPVGLLILTNFLVGAMLTFGMGYADSSRLDSVFDAVTGALVALWFMRRPKVWKFVIVACLASQCVVYATMRPWEQLDATPTAYLINLLLLILLVALAFPGGRHALERSGSDLRALHGWRGLRLDRPLHRAASEEQVDGP